MKNLIATVDDDFAQIDRLLKELRNRIARAAEAVHFVAEEASKQARRRQPRKKAAKRRK